MSVQSELNSLTAPVNLAGLLEITIPPSEALRITDNNASVMFEGYEYSSFPFDFGQLKKVSEGSVPSWTLVVDNTTRVMDSYMQDYDQYLKDSGSADAVVTMRAIVLNALNPVVAIMEEFFDLTSWKTTAKSVEFVLGAPNPMTMRFPRRRIRQKFCDFKFRVDPRCGYSGSAAACDNSITSCRQLGNSGSFGGFVGIGPAVQS